MADVPGRFDVSIDGIGFMLFEEGDQPALMHQSIRTQREQSGGAAVNTGEQTVNPEGFWRRSRDGWHHGAGQSYGDREESDQLRFRESQGVDVFSTRHQVTLLHELAEAHTVASTGFKVLHNINGRVYVSDGSTLEYTSTPLTTPWSTTAVTGLPAVPTFMRSMASTGTTLFISCDGDGIYSHATGGSTASSYVTGSVSGVAFAKGRLMAWNGVNLYNVTAAGALPSPLTTFPTGSIISGVTGARNHIYIGVSGSPSQVYKTTIKPDGTALDVPTVAGELPAGERLIETNDSVFGYLGFLFVSTSAGIRMASIDDEGNLTFGSVIPSAYLNVTGWAAWDRFVYFTYVNPELAWFGVGVMDLSTQILPNTPGYARHLFLPDTSEYPGALTAFNGKLIALMTDEKVYVESTGYIEEGFIDSGLLALDLADAKTPVAIDVEAGGLDASETIVEAISVDRGTTFTDVATWNSQDDGEMPITGVAASRQFELRTTLTGDGTSTPTLYRHTLKAEPNVSQSDYIIVRLRLFESIIDNTGAVVGQSPAQKRAALRALQQSREVVELAEGDDAYQVTVRDLDDQYISRCSPDNGGDWNSVATARMKVISGPS